MNERRVMSRGRGRRPGLCHAEMAAASACVQGRGRWAPYSGGSSDFRNHRSAIRQGGGGGEEEGRAVVVADFFVLDPRSMSEKQVCLSPRSAGVVAELECPLGRRLSQRAYEARAELARPMCPFSTKGGPTPAQWRVVVGHKRQKSASFADPRRVRAMSGGAGVCGGSRGVGPAYSPGAEPPRACAGVRRLLSLT